MASIEELRLDIEELQKLSEQAVRAKVKDILTIQLRKLQTELINQQEKQAQEQEPKADSEKTVPKPKTSQRYVKNITNYGWDQSDKFMKIYVTDLKGIHNVPKENISSEFTERSFKVKISNLDGKDYSLHVAPLFEKIIPDESSYRLKTDRLTVFLKKTSTKTWAHVTDKEKKQKEKKPPKMDETKDPSAGLMDMLKGMYDDGDDDMKRTISKAWCESQSKKASGDLGGELGL